METRTCSCRYWDLSGLPCSHAISAIYCLGKEVDDYIAPCYKIEVYDQVYSDVLQPVEGKEKWPLAPNPRPFPPQKKKMPGRPQTERRREEQEKPKGDKLSRKGCIIKCSACGGLNHNKRKCTSNPDVVREHAQQKKKAKCDRRKQARAPAKDASSSSQQQPQDKERHVLYYEKPVRKRSKGTAPAQQHAPAPHPSSAQQHGPAPNTSSAQQHGPVNRPFIPPKKKQVPPSSQPSSEASASQSSSQPKVARRQTIPMCDVVTEAVPKEGRLKWYLLGNNKGGGGGQGEDNS